MSPLEILDLKNKELAACHEHIATDGDVCPTGLGADKISQAGVSAHPFSQINLLAKRADLGETVFLKTMKIFELRCELTVDATVPNRER